jgi:peptidyl-prolyl cis-trans isomerase SurA
MRLRLARLALLGLALGGCAVPGWVPWLGTKQDRPKPPVVAEAAREAAANAAARDVTTSKVEKLAEPRPARPADESVSDRVVAVVNNDAITLAELQEAIAAYRYENRQAAEPSDELIQQFLARMIESRLQLQEAEREKIVVEEAEVEEELTERIKKINVRNREEFERLIKTQGLSMDGIKKRIRDGLKVTRLIRRKVTARISVTDVEISGYLEANREKLETGLGYHARHILVTPEVGDSDAAWEAARIKAELLRTQLLQGADFAELARQHSKDATAKDGGDLGTLKRGELAQDVESQILSLRSGEISKPYRSALGYHIFRLESKDGLEGEGLQRAQAQIRDILFREKYEARLDAWIKEIKQRAVIEVRL